ncbi:MAG TPA: S1/P1 nuclease, partial [Pyrinomonadaceae bacterium]
MKKILRLVASTLLVVTLTAPAYGWGNVGHMAVAFVAYRRLRPATRARVDRLVALNPKIDEWRALLPRRTSAADRRMMLFMIAATWADQIKGDARYHSDGTHGGNVPPDDASATRNTGYDDFARHKYWHFVDLPFSPDGTPTQPPPVPNALTQIDAFRAVLASNRPDELKSYDLVWLLHMVGDVHQPLHGTARFISADTDGDDGGNDVKICNPA